MCNVRALAIAGVLSLAVLLGAGALLFSDDTVSREEYQSTLTDAGWNVGPNAYDMSQLACKNDGVDALRPLVLLAKPDATPEQVELYLSVSKKTC